MKDEEKKERRPGGPADEKSPRPKPAAPETAERPAAGIDHEPEPDAENLMPAKDRPGTL